ncbi:hypothetical protein [Bifidobacterium simiarum]|uniref:Uncharacterized protein n=1 Tax=Bifidobacterium simiarum TaxID=2045441 RepID=A0A2M9HEW0_9BIFI|nr:hypothetical protein [Bifidobacterium simiarum]PJM75342.1 hypothetical protein CSQ87_04825 [Bifidobacterium simiarum]
MPMLIILFLWVALVVALVVYVLIRARRESHRTDFFYNMDQDPESQRRKPRAVSTNIAFTPSRQVRRGSTAPEHEHATAETPVYVNDPSVVEVRALGRGIDIPDLDAAKDQPNGSAEGRSGQAQVGQVRPGQARVGQASAEQTPTGETSEYTGDHAGRRVGEHVRRRDDDRPSELNR